MSRIFLTGHTGSKNHGCEAIVRSTINVLDKLNITGEKFLYSFAKNQDLFNKLDEIIDIKEYNKRSISKKLYGKIMQKFGNITAWQRTIQSGLWQNIKEGDICLNIGGDIYCYKGCAYISYELNKEIYGRAKSVFWACSIESALLDNEMLADLKRYTYIVPREQLTYDLLVDKGIEKDKIIKTCDPAFWLGARECELPNGFVIGNTIGINLSMLIIKEMKGLLYNNVINLFEYILKNTQFHICLIPHVYSAELKDGDYATLHHFYDKYKNTGRLSFVNRDLSCEQLKYIISKCSLFVGARTHATIAAYSSLVPTLVLGYSVKSRGIAMDLFGDWHNFVIPSNEVSDENDFVRGIQFIIKNQQKIKERLEQYIPEYKNQIFDLEKIFEL